MSRTHNRVKHWRSQPLFDREILERLKIEELKFLCRKYYKDLCRKRYNNPKDILGAKQRYKQLCEEIENRNNNLNASMTYYALCNDVFDINNGDIYDFQNGTIVENVSFNVNENDYVVYKE